MDEILTIPGFRRAEGARTLSFFCDSATPQVDSIMIDTLAEAARRAGGAARLCLHRDPQDPFHDMVIVESASGYARPHRHHAKGETCHVIRGSVAMVQFDDQGSILHVARLAPGGGTIARVAPRSWHTVLVLSEDAVYHESKPGPFDPACDAELPSWAPVGQDAQDRWMSDLRRRVCEAPWA
ncbi:hypothetical protein H261_07903 [Paramagnetospirillum caucaseum]|uniref:Cupin fold metalloprotein WbuC cupin domain-containing protein n=1 Tax=Paramagnetospirillum caucaseum TaxID=1244869 RepID=M2ZT52_9PROT|nr:WbuC family cupin fold metalloprotein [Paramagnetospirillum caucaseum]EME70537.1 hypothetical protein H261_07903 [Paramagnetospirillum caucaseum]